MDFSSRVLLDVSAVQKNLFINSLSHLGTVKVEVIR